MTTILFFTMIPPASGAAPLARGDVYADAPVMGTR